MPGSVVDVPAPEERTGDPGIYRRGSRYVVRFRDKQGRSRKRSARTLAEARLLKKASEVDVARGEFHDSSNVTFEVYARDWVENYRGRTKRGARPQDDRRIQAHPRIDCYPLLWRDAVGRSHAAGHQAVDRRTRTAHRLGKGRRAATRVEEHCAARGRACSRAASPTRSRRATFAKTRRSGFASTPCQTMTDEDVVKALEPAELQCLVAEVPEEHRLLGNADERDGSARL